MGKNKLSRELAHRFMHHGAFKLNGSYWCAVHPGIELSDEGGCSECDKTFQILAADMREAAAMNRAALIQEHDL